MIFILALRHRRYLLHIPGGMYALQSAEEEAGLESVMVEVCVLLSKHAPKSISVSEGIIDGRVITAVN